MTKVLRMAIASAAIVMLATPALAQTCKEEAVSATSREYVSRSLGAFPGSWAAWRKAAKEQHGDGWQAWRRAKDRNIDCKQAVNDAGRKRWTCTRTAVPCRPGSGDTNADSKYPSDLAPITRVLRRGDRGDQVKTLQYLLDAAGYEVDADGVFGRGTEKALKSFQRKSNLKVDGRAGPKTIEALTG